MKVYRSDVNNIVRQWLKNRGTRAAFGVGQDDLTITYARIVLLPNVRLSTNLSSLWDLSPEPMINDE